MAKKKSTRRAVEESNKNFDATMQDMQQGNDTEAFGAVRAAKALAAEVIKLTDTLSEISLSLQTLEDLSLDIDSLKNEISSLQSSLGFLISEMGGKPKAPKATKKKSASKKKPS